MGFSVNSEKRTGTSFHNFPQRTATKNLCRFRLTYFKKQGNSLFSSGRKKEWCKINHRVEDFTPFTCGYTPGELAVGFLWTSANPT